MRSTDWSSALCTSYRYSRTINEIGGAFPEIVGAMSFDAILDGELLVHPADSGGPPYKVAPFNDLQQRLNRNTVAPKQLREQPAFVRLYDMLFEGTEDLDRKSTRLNSSH